MSKKSTQAVVKRLKEIASTLGRTPARDELRVQDPDLIEAISHSFGSYTIAIQAAGLDSCRVGKKEKIKELFRTSIVDQIRGHKKKKVETHLKLPKAFSIAVFGDLHFPFVSKDKLNRALDLLDNLRPTHVVQIGDLMDLFAFSHFPRSRNIYTPYDETMLAREMACQFWDEVERRSPGCKKFQILGNHDARPFKRVMEGTPDAEGFFAFQTLFEFEGVTTLMDTREELCLESERLGRIWFLHGYLGKLGAHRDFMLDNVVTGHSHTGGVVYRGMSTYSDKTPTAVRWELNAGLLGDPEAKALSYTPQRITKWTHGLGVIDELGPRFIPL